jgi:septum formation protein
MKNRLILASRSPRRLELLSQLGLDFDVIPSRAKEDSMEGETPDAHVLRLAEKKTTDVAGQYPDRWVIGADTIVCIDKSILGKPKNREEAVEMLTRLSGREHHVFTGFAVHHEEKGVRDRQATRTAVKVKRLTRPEMEWYAGTGESFDKAGGYAIQGIGAFMIESIRGSYTNVVGLPMCELIRTMIRLGAISASDSGFRISD